MLADPQSREADMTTQEEIRDSSEFDLIILSDLHLSEGRDPTTKKFSLNEDFFFDDSFGRFLTYLRKESGRKWKLIFAGDMVDFLQVKALPKDRDFPTRETERIFGLGTSPDKTIWKLKRIMDGHWRFFEALGKFISAGNRCAIISGNHDIEWSVPKVRNAFLKQMGKYVGSEEGNTPINSIEFCPWFYYEPGLVWVEHGHQYDELNSFDYFLYPYLPGSEELMLPAGSFFVRYLFNTIERLHPFADNIKPISAYLKNNWQQLLLSKDVKKHATAFWRILKKVRKFSSEELQQLSSENNNMIKQEAYRFGIVYNKLEAIRDLWLPSSLYNKSTKDNFLMFFCYESSDGLPKMASRICQELGVRYVVFGHTHNADLRATKPDWSAEYVNSGTWTKIFSNDMRDRLLHEEQESVFVRLLKSENNKMELLKWREDIDDAAWVNLFERR
jgi:UDP-2,3-diacylglucosamine pyrophosphatase LpxH